MILGCWMMILGILFIILMMIYSSLFYGKAVVQTRTDAIADSAAVYGQAFDYKYNQGQAIAMTEELVKRNNEENPVFELNAQIDFPEDDLLTIHGEVTSPMLYSNLTGTNTITSNAESSVRSVDVYGDIWVIPGH